MDTAGQGWTGVWSQFGHCLVIFVGEGFAVGFVDLATKNCPKLQNPLVLV